MSGRDPRVAPLRGLPAILEGKRLVVLVGEGGVGKTSVSAALACERARRGARVAVLTIDPAPRLGDALGLDEMDGEPRTVALEAVGAEPGASLTAMRLDSRRTFDRMIDRHAPTPALARALLAHPLYRAISGQLGGTENFMAFQRLHELLDADDQDCLVLDTPPAANASDLLAAPQRLSGLLTTGAFSVLADPARLFLRSGGSDTGESDPRGRTGQRPAPSAVAAVVSRTAERMTSAGESVARAGVAVLLAALEKVSGTSLRREVGEFAEMFGELAGGLEARSREIDAMLRAGDCAFVLVTRPRLGDVAKALSFRKGLEGLGIRVAAVVVNRVTPPPAAESTPGVLPPRLLEVARKMDKDMQGLRDTEGLALDQLRDGLAAATGLPAPALFLLEDREQDVSSIKDIVGLADALSA